MELTIGVLSDTHISGPTPGFSRAVKESFADCAVIFHAGDLTDARVLEVFAGKEVVAVHGNMCNASSYRTLPQARLVKVAGFTFGLTHGMQYPRKESGYIEDQLLVDFPEADCIIYGHTHVPSCHKIGSVLLLNPGSFRATGHFGAPGSYGIIRVGRTLQGAILQAPHWC